jgi:hypothetical protein
MGVAMNVGLEMRKVLFHGGQVFVVVVVVQGPFNGSVGVVDVAEMQSSIRKSEQTGIVPVDIASWLIPLFLGVTVGFTLRHGRRDRVKRLG